jgi:hypothetical protein
MALLSAAAGWWRFEDCLLALGSTGAANTFNFGTNAGTALTTAVIELINTPLSFGAAGQKVNLRTATVLWRNTPNAIAGTVPTTLAATIANAFPSWDLQGVDLSALGSGKTLFDVSASSMGTVHLLDCKLGASVAITTGAISGPNGFSVTMTNSDSADTIYRLFRQDYRATEQHETTIVRSGGASDGTTPFSRKVVTTSGVGPDTFYRSQPILFFNSITGSQTITVPVLTDNITLQDADAWLEVEYLGTIGNPLGVFADDRVSSPDFSAAANQTADSASSWTTTGLGTPVKQTLDVAVTAAKAGLMRAYVCIAKPSVTVYWDPRALSASGRQYLNEAGVMNEGPIGSGPIIGSAIVRAA